MSGFIPLMRLQGYTTDVVRMFMIVKIFLLGSNMITRVSEASPCINFYTSIYVSSLLGVFLPRLVPFRAWNGLCQGTADPNGSDNIPVFIKYIFDPGLLMYLPSPEGHGFHCWHVHFLTCQRKLMGLMAG